MTRKNFHFKPSFCQMLWLQTMQLYELLSPLRVILIPTNFLHFGQYTRFAV
jgi:hypothetical protein